LGGAASIRGWRTPKTTPNQSAPTPKKFSPAGPLIVRHPLLSAWEGTPARSGPLLGHCGAFKTGKHFQFPPKRCGQGPVWPALIPGARPHCVFVKGDFWWDGDPGPYKKKKKNRKQGGDNLPPRNKKGGGPNFCKKVSGLDWIVRLGSLSPTCPPILEKKNYSIAPGKGGGGGGRGEKKTNEGAGDQVMRLSVCKPRGGRACGCVYTNNFRKTRKKTGVPVGAPPDPKGGGAAPREQSNFSKYP